MRRSLSTALFALALVACGRKTPTTPPGDTGGIIEPPIPSAGASSDTSPKLAMDPDIVTGKLDNGLTYYIRHHEKPEKRVLLWLAVDAGSVLEDDDQRGLAHFVEHMAFNGTKRFAKNTLIDFLEKAGVDFGADLNAFTSFDETVYQLKVPTDDPGVIAKGFDILEDWASAISFDPGEVDKERGVVIEEWRLGRGAGQRVFDKQWPVFLQGSKYADRKPIGEKDILEKAPVATLKRFYTDWYRPDLMALVVVGDVDPKAMEKEIRTRFGGLKNPDKERPRPAVPVPLLDKTRAAVFNDAEMSMTSVDISIKGKKRELQTENDYRGRLVESLFHGMLRARLDEIRQKPDAPFVFAFSSTSTMGRAVDVFDLTAGAKAGRVEDALSALLTEVERVKQHGFLASELERERARSLRQAERNAAEKATTDGRAYAFQTVRNHLEHRAMLSRDAELELAKRMLPSIQLDEVNALAAKWTAQTDRVISASGPARDKLPGEKDLLAIADAVGKTKLAAYEDHAESGELLAQAPTPGTVTKKQEIPEIGVSVWTLSNGIKVVLKPTDFKNDEVMFEAFSPGGHSLVPNKKFHSAQFADQIVMRSGVGDHDAVALRNLLAGKVASVSPFIGELEEGVRGNASPRDLELALELVYLNLTAPREDAAAFESWRAASKEFVKNRDLSPQRAFFEQLGAFAAGEHFRRQPLSTEVLDDVDSKVALEVYRERFADVGDLTFMFVGNIDAAKLEPLVNTYLASLPSKKKKEKWKDVGVKPPAGVKKFELRKGQDPKSFVSLEFHGNVRWTPEAEVDLDILADVLEIRLREVLREDMSGVYGAFSNGSISRRPKQRYEFNIGFGCGPENADRLRQAVFEIATSIKKDGIGADVLDKVREKRRRALETQMKENRFWLAQLGRSYRFGTDPKKILEQEKMLERVTAENVKAAAKKFIDEKSLIEGRLWPEAAPAADRPKAAG